MSKQVMWSTNDSTGKSRQTVQSYHPVWMAHWMRKGSNTTADRRDAGASANKELDHESKDDHITSEAPNSVKGPNVESLRVISKRFGNEGMRSTQTEHGHDTGDTQAIRPSIDHNLHYSKTNNHQGGIQLSSGVLAANEKFSREYHSSIEGTSKKSVELVKTHFPAKDGSSSTSMPARQRFVRPSTYIVPYQDLERYNKGKAVVSQSIGRPSIFFNNQFPDAKLKIIGQEDGQKHFHWGSGMGQSSEKNVQKVPRYENYPLQKFPSCVHETMRICTTVDSVEATPRGCPWFSQTTHSLLITKNTDVNVSKETDIFRRLITQMNENSSSDHEYVHPFFGQANRGVTLQPISSSNSEGHGNIGDTGIGTSNYASKNESSAETDTMDMDFSKEEIPKLGENSTCSTKVFNFDNNSSPQINVASSREVGRHWPSSGRPDINLELPALPAVASSSEDAPTSSRTQSLEMDILLAQAEHPEPKSDPSLNVSPRADPTTRWVKRLRLSSSDSSAQGTKSLKLAEKSSHDKKRVFFRRILRKGITREHRNNKTFLADRSGNLSKEDELSKKSKELLLSHVWIKRWLRNGSQKSQRKPETVVVCEPQSLKPTLDDDLQKKQFPSIAAMALMGRSMNGLHSCELEKRGTFTIWNTNTF